MNRNPEYLAHCIGMNGRNGRIRLQNPQLTLSAKSFCFRGASLWNKLPEELRCEVKIGTFKKKLRSWILENISRFNED